MISGKTDTLLIKTPEGVVFSLLLAGPVTRFLAWAIDLACITVATSFVGMTLSLLKLISLDLVLTVMWITQDLSTINQYLL